MSVTIDMLIFLGVISTPIVTAFLWVKHRRKSGSSDRAPGVPEGTSFLNALLHCATCSQVVSCHRYIEDQRVRTGRVEKFCPRSDFLLRLTGRQRDRKINANG